MREERGGFVIAPETVTDEILIIGVVDGLGEYRTHAAVRIALENMWSVDFDFPAIIGAVHLESKPSAGY